MLDYYPLARWSNDIVVDCRLWCRLVSIWKPTWTSAGRSLAWWAQEFKETL